MTANPSDDPYRSRDIARVRELTSPYLPDPGAPIGLALVHLALDQRAEVIAIFGRLGDLDESTSG